MIFWRHISDQWLSGGAYLRICYEYAFSSLSLQIFISYDEIRLRVPYGQWWLHSFKTRLQKTPILNNRGLPFFALRSTCMDFIPSRIILWNMKNFLKVLLFLSRLFLYPLLIKKREEGSVCDHITYICFWSVSIAKSIWPCPSVHPYEELRFRIQFPETYVDPAQVCWFMFPCLQTAQACHANTYAKCFDIFSYFYWSCLPLICQNNFCHAYSYAHKPPKIFHAHTVEQLYIFFPILFTISDFYIRSC